MPLMREYRLDEFPYDQAFATCQTQESLTPLQLTSLGNGPCVLWEAGIVSRVGSFAISVVP